MIQIRKSDKLIDIIQSIKTDTVDWNNEAFLRDLIEVLVKSGQLDRALCLASGSFLKLRKEVYSSIYN
jgi:hypothetical protein